MKTGTRIALLSTLLIFLTFNRVSAQVLPDSTIQKINNFFTKWNNSYSPGCAMGIVRNDSLIFANGYGMANLEYGIPNTPETIFHMASVSKQFTAYSLMLLVKEGKIKLDDDIRKYLPWFPDLKVKISVHNLLNHTSGIRDQWQLLAISGTRLDDVITQDQIVKILGKQQALNFNPGEKYSYSNSNFTLLAEIVKSITGKTLRQFTDSAIFKPLGMNNTHFHDDYKEIVKNRAYSYERKDSIHFANSILSYSNAGATSLFTNVTDMSKWIMNLYNPKVGNQSDIDLLTKKSKLNNGKEINYAAGILSDTWKGWRQYSHGGSDAGYRTYINAFPDLKMGFIVFANVGDFNTGAKAYELADLFIRDTTAHKAVAREEKTDSSRFIIKNISTLRNYEGAYISEEGIDLSIEIKNNKLYYSIGNDSALLGLDSLNTYSMAMAPQVKFTFGITGKDTGIVVTTPDESFHMKKYIKKTHEDDITLMTYTGKYYCPELDCSYGIMLKDHKLFLTNSKYNDVPLNLSGTNHLLDDYWWINHLVVIRNDKNQITGFEVDGQRVMHLRFNKIK
jgi:CubicO group peptidase (beta-lactamase class C family)